MCLVKIRIPVTEYAFSPREATSAYENPWAPESPPPASETTQAVYYLRSCLMNSTMQASGIGWTYSLYFHHPREATTWVPAPGNTIKDWGFHDFNGYPGSSRAIRYVAREIFCGTGTQPGLGADAKIWSPLDTKGQPPDRTAWCGWVRGDGELWGAIWRYENSDHYYVASPASRDFIVDSDYEVYDAYPYRFTISDGTATFDSAGGSIAGDYSPSTDQTTWSIPNVSNNPTFLRFE